MRVPKQLSIAGHTIQVKYVKVLRYGGDDCWGLWDDDKHIIYLKMGMDKTREMEVLLHESMHAIEDIIDIELGEEILDRLAREVLALIRNNKLNFLERRKPVK